MVSSSNRKMTRYSPISTRRQGACPVSPVESWGVAFWVSAKIVRATCLHCLGGSSLRYFRTVSFLSSLRTLFSLLALMEQTQESFHRLFWTQVAALRLGGVGARRPPRILKCTKSRIFSPAQQHCHLATVAMDDKGLGPGLVEVLSEAIFDVGCIRGFHISWNAQNSQNS